MFKNTWTGVKHTQKNSKVYEMIENFSIEVWRVKKLIGVSVVCSSIQQVRRKGWARWLSSKKWAYNIWPNWHDVLMKCHYSKLDHHACFALTHALVPSFFKLFFTGTKDGWGRQKLVIWGRKLYAIFMPCLLLTSLLLLLSCSYVVPFKNGGKKCIFVCLFVQNYVQNMRMLRKDGIISVPTLSFRSKWAMSEIIIRFLATAYTHCAK